MCTNRWTIDEARRGASDIEQINSRVFNEREFNEKHEDFSTRRSAMISSVLRRGADGDGNFIFIIFRDRPLFSRARNPASRLHGAYSRELLAKWEIARFAERSIDKCYPWYPSLARMRHVASSIYIIVVRLEIFALSKSARFFFGYRSDRAGRAL